MVKAQMQDCCTSCCETRQACLQMIKLCSSKGGSMAEPKLMSLLLETATLCQSCADFCALGSEKCGSILAACAKLAEECAKELDKCGDAQSKKCADSCRLCAQACRGLCSTQDLKIAA